MVGGQVCVFYGAAEFSRDLALALSVAPENLEKLEEVLKELQAELIAVPLKSRDGVSACATRSASIIIKDTIGPR